MEGIETSAPLATSTAGITSVFPHLAPENAQLSVYSGYIEIKVRPTFLLLFSHHLCHISSSSTDLVIFPKGEYFKLAIYGPNSSAGESWNRISSSKSAAPSGFAIYGCSKLASLLKGSEDMIQRRMTQSSSISAFCVEFKHLVEQLLLRASTAFSALQSSKMPSACYYTLLLEEINGIGWDRIAELNNELNRISIRLLDSSSREHIVVFQLLPDYPISAPICTHYIPSRFEPKWISRTSRLSDLCEQFCAQFELHQDLWRMLDDFDTNTIVIEPLNPLRSDLTRRIQISKFVSLRLELSAHNPLGVPVFSLLGAESTISPIRDRINANLGNWDYKKSTRQNFETLAGIEFPTRESMKETDKNANGEIDPEHLCAVCYGYKIGNSIPDQSCNNVSCARVYHATCLYDWFQSIQPTTRVTTALLWGACPYCEQKISVRNPHAR